MFYQKFQDIVNEFDCEFDYVEYEVDGNLGSKLAISIYILKVFYRNVTIDVKFELGNHSIAEFYFEIFPNRILPKFAIEAKDNFTRLFNFNQKVWNINWDDALTSFQLRRILDASELTNLAKEEAFEPQIIGEKIRNKIGMRTKYFLGFNNKENSLRTVLKYNFAMIDFFLD